MQGEEERRDDNESGSPPMTRFRLSSLLLDDVDRRDVQAKMGANFPGGKWRTLWLRRRFSWPVGS